MAQKLEQTQTQAQLQQLSTLQVALAGLVELPLADLAERVQNEMMSRPPNATATTKTKADRKTAMTAGPKPKRKGRGEK